MQIQKTKPDPKEITKKVQKTINKKFMFLRPYMEGPKDRADVKLKKF